MDILTVSKDWNIPQKHRTNACFNCGDPDHGIPKCPKPIDQARIDKAKADFSRNVVGRGGQDSRFNSGCGQGHGRGGGNKSYTHGKWKGSDKASSALSTVGGIGKHKGKWCITCKTCGWNTTHTSRFHDSCVKDPHAFSLPSTHMFWTKSGKKPPTGGGRGTIAPAPAAQSATTGSIGSATSLLSTCVGPLIAQYKTRSEDGHFASFLAGFERVLN